MAVPEEVRSVKRPPRTVVCDSGHDGPEKYMVRERSMPDKKNGRVIGHIYDGRFIPCKGKRLLPDGVPEEASYGGAAVAYLYSKDLFEDLSSIFNLSHATDIIVSAE